MNGSSLLRFAFLTAVLHASIASAAEPQAGHPVTGDAQQKITRAGDRPSISGPAEYFTGRVRIDPVWPADESINAAGGLVTFEPDARSAWHNHPAGQRLTVVSGMGLTQE